MRPHLLPPLLLLPAACNLNRLTADSTADVLDAARPAIERERDFALARDALPAQLKMIESFLEVSPRNPTLLTMCSQAYGQYAFGFVEDDLEQAQAAGDFDRAEATRHRARALYLRGYQFGLRLLALRSEPAARAVWTSDDDLRARVAELSADAVPGLFWTAFSLGGAINLGRDQPWLLPYMTRVEILLARARALDERYFFAGPLLATGVLYGGRGPMFGGDFALAGRSFARAHELFPGFLLTRVMHARALAVQTQDRDLYQRLLGEVLAADLDRTLPEQRLANTIAQRRAARYLAQIDELF